MSIENTVSRVCICAYIYIYIYIHTYTCLSTCIHTVLGQVSLVDTLWLGGAYMDVMVREERSFEEA